MWRNLPNTSRAVALQRLYSYTWFYSDHREQIASLAPARLSLVSQWTHPGLPKGKEEEEIESSWHTYNKRNADCFSRFVTSQ